MQAGRRKRQHRVGQHARLVVVEVDEEGQLTTANCVQHALLGPAALPHECGQNLVPQMALECGQPEAAKVLRQNRDRTAEISRLAGQESNDVRAAPAVQPRQEGRPVAPLLAKEALGSRSSGRSWTFASANASQTARS